MATYTVACLDVFAPRVQQVVKEAAPRGFEVHFAESYDQKEQYELATRADFILVGGATLSASMIEDAPDLRMIQKWGIGVDKIDLDAARRRNIPVTITSSGNAGPVAELAVGLMLAVYRRIAWADRRMREGAWAKSEMRASCYQIAGKTVGLLGFGAIARMTARRLSGFDARIAYFDPVRADPTIEAELKVTCVSFDELLSQSDILSIHTPLTAQTKGMIGRDALARMKNNAVIINTARGGVVDEAALCEALTSGRIAGAGLDSYEVEPLDPASPLLKLDQVVFTPHAGGGVFDNVENVARHAFGNMMKLLEDKEFAPADVIVPRAKVA